jgi:hypothetical protein
LGEGEGRRQREREREKHYLYIFWTSLLHTSLTSREAVFWVAFFVVLLNISAFAGTRVHDALMSKPVL